MRKRHEHDDPRRQVADRPAHPALLLIGIADRETAPPAGFDVAREHDRAHADAEIASWRTP